MTQFPHYDSEKGRVVGVVQRVTCRPHASAGRCLVYLWVLALGLMHEVFAP